MKLLFHLLSLAVVSCFLTAACKDSRHHKSPLSEKPPTASKPETIEEINAGYRRRNLTHFQKYLSECPEHEIRCLWFPGNQLQAGMIMTVDLKAHKVHTACDVFNHAYQGAQIRPLSFEQVTFLEEHKLKMQFNESSKTVEFTAAVHVVYWHEGVRQTRSYPRISAPKFISDIYETCDCSYDDIPNTDR